MSRITWDKVRMLQAFSLALRSRCSRAQVGCVVATAGDRLVSEGYNGPPANFTLNGNPLPEDLRGCKSFCERASSDGEISASTGYGFSCPTIHAEMNALLYVDRSVAEGGTLYVTSTPCADCAKVISNSGISRVVSGSVQAENRPDPREFFESCGLTYEILLIDEDELKNL